MISLKKVSVSFEDAVGNKITALRDVDLDIQKGACVAVMGPSGSGKSTLLKVIAKLINKESSRINSKGSRVNFEGSVDVRSSKIGYMAQESKDVVVPWKKVDEALPDSDFLHSLGLRDKAGHWPSKLSGGQLRRLALGHVLYRDRDIFLLDEPMTGLDMDLRKEMAQVIKGKVEKNDILLFVTHYFEEAEALADWAIYIDKGMCIKCLTMGDLQKQMR